MERDIEVLKSRFDSVKQNKDDFAILGAQREFEGSNVNLFNPRLIDEEIQFQKEIFSKLKFIYLEQETRDKFLRRISELTSDEIDKNHVQNIESESLARKAEFKNLKTQMYHKIDQIQYLSRENTELYDRYSDKLQQTNDMLDQVAHLQKEIDDVLRETEGNEVPSSQLINDVAQYVTEDSNYEQILQLNQKNLHETQSRLEQLSENIESKKLAVSDQEAFISTSVKKLKELKALVTNLSPFPTNDKVQKYAKWCKEMNRILIKFTDLNQLELTPTHEQHFKLTIEWPSSQGSLTFDEHFQVQSFEGFSDSVKSELGYLQSSDHDEDTFLTTLAGLVTKTSV